MSWERVDSLEHFRAFLLGMSREAASEDCSWLNTTVPRFLSGWVSYLVTTEEPYENAPGWRGLASFLHYARDHEYIHPCHRPSDLIDSEERVSTVSDLMFYLLWLCEDFDRDQQELADRRAQGLWAGEGRWAHSPLSAWLESWAAWLEDAHTPTNPWRERSEVEPVTWRSCANQLAAARMYE
jgi:hypothetical protein